VVDAMTGVLLITQGLAETGQTASSRALIAVTLVGGVLILAAMIRRRRLGAQFDERWTSGSTLLPRSWPSPES
jgi:hypothetical protein